MLVFEKNSRIKFRGRQKILKILENWSPQNFLAIQYHFSMVVLTYVIVGTDMKKHVVQILCTYVCKCMYACMTWVCTKEVTYLHVYVYIVIYTKLSTYVHTHPLYTHKNYFYYKRFLIYKHHPILCIKFTN